MVKIWKKESESVFKENKFKEADYIINTYLGCSDEYIYCYGRGSFKSFEGCTSCRRLSEKVSITSLRGKKVVIGTFDDPYSFKKAKFMNTREILKKLMNLDIDLEIITSYSLILRDIDILKKIKKLQVGIYITTEDNERKGLRDKSNKILRKINIIKRLNSEKIYTYAFMSKSFSNEEDIRLVREEILNDIKCFYFEDLNLI